MGPEVTTNALHGLCRPVLSIHPHCFLCTFLESQKWHFPDSLAAKSECKLDSTEDDEMYSCEVSEGRIEEEGEMEERERNE